MQDFGSIYSNKIHYIYAGADFLGGLGLGGINPPAFFVTPLRKCLTPLEGRFTPLCTFARQQLCKFVIIQPCSTVCMYLYLLCKFILKHQEKRVALLAPHPKFFHRSCEKTENLHLHLRNCR